jgi:uncharacterized integral membrane protein
MIRLIFSIVLLVVLAILVVFNARYTTPFSLFGWKAEEVPVIAVALVSFVLGVVYSFVFYFLRFLDRRHRMRLKERGEQVRTRERALEEEEGRRKEAEAAAADSETAEGRGLLGRRKKKKTP